MVSANDELTSLGYNSSQPDLDLAPKAEVKPEDQADLPALERVLKVIQQRKAFYDSRAALTYGIDITVENQLIVNTQLVLRLQELESLIMSTITNVREKMNEQR